MEREFLSSLMDLSGEIVLSRGNDFVVMERDIDDETIGHLFVLPLRFRYSTSFSWARFHRVYRDLVDQHGCTLYTGDHGPHHESGKKWQCSLWQEGMDA